MINILMITYKDIIHTPSILKNYSSREKVPLICQNCFLKYSSSKHNIQCAIRKGCTNNFCSKQCNKQGSQERFTIACSECGIYTDKRRTDFKKSKKQNLFCSRSCAASYNTKNKSYGIRRSKLESWLESELNILYPNLEIHFNRKDTIGYELDIYIPSMKIAFEINGITHYKPIYGQHKFQQIQNNDFKKSQLCHENGILLYSIDTSNQNHFTPENSLKFLKIIINIINDNS